MKIKHIETGNIYNSVEAAANAIGVAQRTMLNYLTLSRKKVNGLHFVKENEDGTFPEVVIEKEELKTKELTNDLIIWFNNTRSLTIKNYKEPDLIKLSNAHENDIVRLDKFIISIAKVTFIEINNND